MSAARSMRQRQQLHQQQHQQQQQQQLQQQFHQQQQQQHFDPNCPYLSGRAIGSERTTPLCSHKGDRGLSRGNIDSIPPLLSRSTITLQNMDAYGSYSLLPGSSASGGGGAGGGGGSDVECLKNRTTPCYRHYAGGATTAAHRLWQAPPSPAQHFGSYCCLHSVDARTPAIMPLHKCVCAKAYQQQQQHQHQQSQPPPPPPPQAQFKAPEASPLTMHGNHRMPYGSMCYLGYDHGMHWTEEDDSALPALQDREFHILHRNIPGLRRTGVDTEGIRQYFYPEGGWGWIICGMSFLVHILSTGMQLSYGLLLFYAVQHLHTPNGIEWLGALSWSISMIVTPFVVTYCRTKSARLLAVIGGLFVPLGVLFTSFATELSQIIFSYGIVFGVGTAMIRESSNIMIGTYFKRRRKFVEMVAMSGEGVGIALFSVVLKEGVGKAGWRLGLQIIAALMATTFFMGLLYRPASLYHPQRRVIQHLKNQNKKIHENNISVASVMQSNTVKYFFLDISALNSATVRILLMASGIAALGIYTPMFLMSLNAAKEGADVQDLVLLQAFLGMSTVFGVVLAGILIRRPFRVRQFLVTTEVVSQVFISTIAISILFLSFIMGYKGLCILSWMYGIGFGGFRYSLKILALERIKLRQFSKAWGLIRGIEAIPVMASVPLTSFLNDYSMKYGRAGYYICAAAAAIAAIIIFFINYSSMRSSARSKKCGSTNMGNGTIASTSLRASSSMRRPIYTRPEWLRDEYFYYGDGASGGCDYPSMDLLNRSCIDLNQLERERSYTRRSSCYERSELRPPPQCLLHHHQRYQPSLHQFHQVQHKLLTPPPPPPATTAERYHYGQGSVGAHAGKRLQKSLSFIQNPYCCDGQWFCNCYQSMRWTPVQQQNKICTCHSLASSTYLHSSAKSRSVPEGLAAMSEQCNCRMPPSAATALSRDIIYLQKPFTAPTKNVTGHVTENNVYGGSSSNMKRLSATTPVPARCRQQRSLSITRPVHFVEQITTSV